MNRQLTPLYLVVIMATLLLVTGCGKKVPTAPVFSPVAQSLNLTKENVQGTIIQAGHQLGWIIVPESDSTLKATLNIRSHQLICTIKYDTNGYTISYASSVNLKYKDGKIHRQYRNWLLYLQDAINKELAFVSRKTN